MNTPRSLGRMWMKIAAVVLACFFVKVSLATTVIPPQFEELVNESDYIVRAVVKSVTSEFASPGSRQIFTNVELEVLEAIVGDPPEPLVLRMLGGRVGDKRMVVQGAPEFKVGEESILFISGNGRTIVPLVGMMHGRYPIEHEPASGRAYVMRNNREPLESAKEVSGEIRGEARIATGDGRREVHLTEAMSPQEFAAAIRAVRKPGTGRPSEK